MSALWQRLRAWRWPAAGILSVACFAVLAGRFWHPYYGFTRFIQLDEADWQSGLPELRAHPVFVYDGFNGYDGAAYAQIAFHPLLDDPNLAGAVGNVPYRARRILGSALAWLLAGGNPARIAPVYAALNVVVWLALAALLWRVLKVGDWRTWLAWAGVLFSAGALHSVRLALTDLLATTLMVAALALAERGRLTGGAGVLALAGLSRETLVTTVTGLWRGPWTSWRAWAANGLLGLGVCLPLLLWLVYIRAKVGPADAGFGNFTWPIIGWLEKLKATLDDYPRLPQFRWLNTTTLLALFGLTAQAAYLLRRIRLVDAWWRAGIIHVFMMGVLGTAVWEGHPGAATRVLLPMGVSFAVLAVRKRATLPWLLAGGLTVFSGVLALWHVPERPHELDAGRLGLRRTYLVTAGSGWHGVEGQGSSKWAWAENQGSLNIETAPPATRPVRVRLRIRAMSPRELEVRSGDAVLWRGNVGTQRNWIEFAAMPDVSGRLLLHLRSNAPAVRESTAPEARALGFAVYEVELDDAEL